MVKKIFIAQSKFLLNAAIRLNKIFGLRQSCFIIIDAKSKSSVSLLKKHGLRQLTPKSFSGKEQKEILKEYLQVFGRLAEWNGNELLWWATDISSKNRYTSPLPPLLLNFIHCLQAITETTTGEKKSLILLSPPWPVIRCLSEAAEQHSWKVILLAWPWARLAHRILGKLKICARLIAEIISCYVRIMQSRIYYGFPPPSITKPVYLIKSFFYENGFKEEGEYHDPFFGDLSTFLTKKLAPDGEVVTVSVCFHKRALCYRQMRCLKENHVIPIDAFITLRDIACASWQIFLTLIKNKFHVGKDITFKGHNIAGLIQECMKSGGAHISLYHLLHRSAAKRIARTYNIIACAFTFEGNPWEKMLTSGLSEVNHNLPIFGCQHSVVPLSAASVFVTRAEQTQGIPLPTKILATGMIPQQIINEFGSLTGIHCEIVGSLRYDYLYKIKTPLRRKNKNFFILVAFEGVAEASDLLDYSLKQAFLSPETTFCLRTHPVLSLKKLLNILSFTDELPSNVKISKGGSVREDVENSDAVLYLGTTVALESIFIGRPIIHFNTTNNLLSNDPLYDLNYFKWNVSADDDLTSIINDIHSLDDNTYDNLRESAKEYIKNYFHSINNNTLSVFLKNL